MHPAALAGVYKRAQYRVRLPSGGCATIRIGAPLPATLVRTLPSTDAPWAFVTAWNPRSRRCPILENRARQRELLGVLRGAPTRVTAGVGMSGDGAWREPSLFVTDVTFGRLDAILRPFGQHAIVRGRGGGRAALHWLD